jgi:hypothetical protein
VEHVRDENMFAVGFSALHAQLAAPVPGAEPAVFLRMLGTMMAADALTPRHQSSNTAVSCFLASTIKARI